VEHVDPQKGRENQPYLGPRGILIPANVLSEPACYPRRVVRVRGEKGYFPHHEEPQRNLRRASSRRRVDVVEASLVVLTEVALKESPVVLTEVVLKASPVVLTEVAVRKANSPSLQERM